MMRFASAAALLGILGCSEPPRTLTAVALPDSTDRPPVSLPGINAGYALLLVNGSPPPSRSPVGAGEWDYDGAMYELVSAELKFKSDDRYVEAWVHRRIGTSVLISQEFTGPYIRVSKSALRIGTAGTVATLTDTGLVWQLPNFTLTYGLSR